MESYLQVFVLLLFVGQGSAFFSQHSGLGNWITARFIRCELGYPTRRDSSGRPQFCSQDSDCDTGDVCQTTPLFNGFFGIYVCCPPTTTFAPFTTPSTTTPPPSRPGVCPTSQVGPCTQVHQCNYDVNCPAPQKCCNNGCGRTCRDPLFPLYGGCGPSGQCTANNAVCSGGLCFCDAGFTEEPPFVCRPDAVGYGQPCNPPQVVCETGLDCIQNFCQCQLNEFRYQTFCVPYNVPYGAGCVQGQTCGPNTVCFQSQQCQCDPETHFFQNGQCVPNTVGYGEPCNSPQVVCETGLDCRQNFCQCQLNEFRYQTFCVPYNVPYGTGCVQGQTCGPNTVCFQSQQCQCDPETHFFQNGQCVPNAVGYDEPCNSPQVVCETGLVCRENRCQCQSYEFRYQTSCLPYIVPYGTPCEGPQTCGANTECSGGVCQCKTGYDYSQASGCAVSAVPPGGHCDTTQQCLNGSPHSHCSGMYCRCDTNYSPFNSICSLDSSGGLGYGDVCTASGLSCTDANTYCGSIGRCICVPTYSYNTVNGLCEQASGGVPLYGDCSGGLTCAGPNTYCHPSTGLCFCVGGYNANNANQCQLQGVASALYNEDCSSGQTCDETNVECRNGFCSCASGTIRRNDACVFASVSLGSSCAAGQTCLGNLAACIGGVCQCPANYVARSGNCVAQDSTSCAALSSVAGFICIFTANFLPCQQGVGCSGGESCCFLCGRHMCVSYNFYNSVVSG